MQSAADIDALTAWWRPPEDGNERRVSDRKLRAVHRLIRERFRELDRDLDVEAEAAKAAAAGTVEHDWWETLVDLECEVVKRAQLNPDKLSTESIDDYTYRRLAAVDGTIYLSDDEWASIGVRPPEPDEDQGKAFTINQGESTAIVYDVPGRTRRVILR